MLKKLILITILASTIISCQFTETMVLNEDGSGTMSVEVNMNEMMAFGAGMMMDSTMTEIDTLISIKQFLLEKKDSISQLPIEEQQKMKAMENFNIRFKMDAEASEMIFDIYTNFSNVNEANELMKGLDSMDQFMPGEETTEESGTSSTEVLGTSYSFSNGIFKRDAFIKDKAAHQKEIDSLKNSEAFLGGMQYTLKYTFPRKIIKSSIAEATYSMDGKTMIIEKSFLDYFKNPDVLDLEVELEK